MSNLEGELAQRPSRLIAEAGFVREAVDRKHSDKFLQLFDFLLQRTIEGRPPSEAEIADEVFSAGRTSGVSPDAAVRVCVHRLRKTIDEIYAGHRGPRLLIPRGAYSLVLTEESAEPQIDGTAERPAGAEGSARSRTALWLALTILLGVAVLALWAFTPHGRDRGPAPLAGTALWHPIASGGRPAIVVLGDYYFFAQASGQDTVTAAPPRLVRDPDINAREDLDIYLMMNPGETHRIADLDQHYVPSGAAMVLGQVYATMRGIKRNERREIDLIPASRLTPDMLKSSDVVYVGRLSGLGLLLRNPLFQASGFKVGATYDELIDTASGKRFQSDGVAMTDERIPRRDYGYIASLPGPSGNNIVIIAGTRDPGVIEMAELASDPDKLRSIGPSASGRREGFEALYQVRTMGNLNVGSTLLLRRSLQSRGIWDKATPSQRFPHDSYVGAGPAAQ